MHLQAPEAPKLRDSKAVAPRAESTRTAISCCFHTAWTLSRPSGVISYLSTLGLAILSAYFTPLRAGTRCFNRLARGVEFARRSRAGKTMPVFAARIFLD